MTRADGKDAILENRGPKIASTKDFLGCSISEHMSATSASVAVIENPLDHPDKVAQEDQEDHPDKVAQYAECHEMHTTLRAGR